MIKQIVFDNGGVIVSSSSRFFLPKFLRYTDKTLSSLVHSYRELAHDLDTGKESEKSFYARFTKHMALRCHWRTIHKLRYGVTRLIPGMTKLVHDLSQHYPLYMLNNEYREFMDFLLRKFSYFQYFRHRLTSCDTGLRKPDQKFFELFLKKFNLKASECLFIDDREDNIHTAHKLGFQVIRFENHRQVMHELRRIGVKV
ncbi:MAG TPA: HAD family phosphatase [Candidatus Nanoarchaeia archaeon]|nr:HAD family phosphatase [Candidatus Nanoarchaeia archaeon]